MRTLDVNSQSPLVIPNYLASSVLDIDFKKIKNDGIDYIAFDADATLVGFRKKALDDKTKKYLEKELRRFKGVCIASNRVTNDLHEIADDINAHTVRATLTTRKPSVKFFHRVVELFDVKPSKIAMVGDKLIADIYGGNKAGFKTVWVDKNGRDSIIDWVVQTRRFERRLTKKHFKRSN